VVCVICIYRTLDYEICLRIVVTCKLIKEQTKMEYYLL